MTRGYTVAVVAATVLLALLFGELLRASGADGAAALRALWTGSVGSRYALTSDTPVRAIPLILAGLAVVLAFRAGVFNIGVEGQLLVGAAAAAALAPVAEPLLGRLTVLAALTAAAAAGAAWAGIAAWLRARFRVLEVISTIMLNFLALHAVGWLVRGPMQEPQHIYPQTAELPLAARLPGLLAGSRLHAGLFVAVLAALALSWTLRSTAAGFRLRAAGANPRAAASAGQVHVGRTTARAFLVSGAIAGIAGGVELTGVTFALYENLSPGYGYTGIAVALLAGLHPLGVLATGLLFGGLEAGATAMQRDAGVPSVIVSVVEAGIILAVVAAHQVGRREDAPA